MTLDVTLLTEPGPGVREAILDALIEHNTKVAGPARWVPFAVVLRAPGETAVQGGLWGSCYYDWCFVELLVVPECGRGQGLGRKLMAEAEAFARQYGASGMWLDTFSFQARGFYEKLGFSAFGSIEGHPAGQSRFFMQRRLQPGVVERPHGRIGVKIVFCDSSKNMCVVMNSFTFGV